MNVRIVIDAEGAFPELAEDIASGNLRKGKLTAITALPAGMASGRTSVGFVAELEDGTKVFIETSLRLFQTAAAGFTGRYGDETVDVAWGVEGGQGVLEWASDEDGDG